MQAVGYDRGEFSGGFGEAAAGSAKFGLEPRYCTNPKPFKFLSQALSGDVPDVVCHGDDS